MSGKKILEGLQDIIRGDALDEIARLKAEIEKLTERCEAYKGQVKNGAIRIEIAEQRCADLTAALDTYREAAQYDQTMEGGR